MNTIDFDHVWMLFQFIISALSNDLALIHDYYLVGKVHIIYCVGY